MSRIVVGHDGTTHSDSAVREALVLGRALALPVVVVRAYTPEESGYSKGVFPQLNEVERAEETTSLAADLAAVVLDFPDVTVEPRAVPGSPVVVLLEESQGARMLVVGARPLGGISRLLGSVSDKLITQAATTVVVVREEVS